MPVAMNSATYRDFYREGEEARAKPFLSSFGSSQSPGQASPDVASSTPLASSPAAEWDLTASLRNLNLARPDPAAWAGGAEWTDFSTDSVPTRASTVGPIQPPAALSRPAAERQPDAAGLCRLHVSNLPFRFRYAELARLFGTYGHVIDAEIISNEKGSKGFGFISLGSAREAAWAREQLHGAIVEGRRIEVNPATTKVTPRAPTLALRRHKSVAEEQELVEAHTRLAEAQLAVLRMQHHIHFPQAESRPTYNRGGQANMMRRVFGC